MIKKEKIKKLFCQKPLKETKHYSKKVSIIVICASALLLALLTVLGIFFINYEFTQTNSFENLVKENYLLSVLFIILICALQVIVAFIPSEVIEIAAGYTFGAWLGALYCLIGIVIGSITVIFLTQKFGRRFVESLYPREKIDTLPIIRDEKKLNLTIAICFLIPGTPKDILTYAIGLTKMRITTYILLTSFARMPSIIISTLSGGAISNDKLSHAILFFSISVVTGLVGYLTYLIFSKKKSK